MPKIPKGRANRRAAMLKNRISKKPARNIKAESRSITDDVKNIPLTTTTSNSIAHDNADIVIKRSPKLKQQIPKELYDHLLKMSKIAKEKRDLKKENKKCRSNQMKATRQKMVNQNISKKLMDVNEDEEVTKYSTTN